MFGNNISSYVSEKIYLLYILDIKIPTTAVKRKLDIIFFNKQGK